MRVSCIPNGKVVLQELWETATLHLIFCLIWLVLNTSLAVYLFFAAWSPLRIDSKPVAPVSPCDEIQVTYKVKNTTNSQANGELELNFKDKNQTYTSFLFCGDSKNNRLDITETKITALNAGDYNLIIRSKEGCTRHLTIRIK
ncbi:MAG: hypothetical protein UZ12_BCD005000488 [Bacteroidetes bacterium OLB12]|nr:MAG: hypothetical protein UZ12_BCD005000488 [Bacteroidetes bacterium OLB12]